MVYWTVQEGETICNLSASNHSSWMSTLLMNILPNHASTCSYIYEWNGIRYGVPFNRQCLLDTLFNTVWRQFYNFLLETHLPNLWVHLCDDCLILYMCHTMWSNQCESHYAINSEKYFETELYNYGHLLHQVI